MAMGMQERARGFWGAGRGEEAQHVVILLYQHHFQSRAPSPRAGVVNLERG